MDEVLSSVPSLSFPPMLTKNLLQGDKAFVAQQPRAVAVLLGGSILPVRDHTTSLSPRPACHMNMYCSTSSTLEHQLYNSPNPLSPQSFNKCFCHAQDAVVRSQAMDTSDEDVDTSRCSEDTRATAKSESSFLPPTADGMIKEEIDASLMVVEYATEIYSHMHALQVS